jgi:hypothetical protein
MASCFAQDSSKHHIHSIKPATDFDQRFYYVPGNRQNVWGYRVGVLINDKYKLGIGGYYMNEKNYGALAPPPLGRTNTGTQTYQQRLYIGTVYYEPYLLRRNLWEMSLVFETGYGRSVNYYVDETNSTVTGRKNTVIVPAGAGLSLNLKLPPLFHIQAFRWFGINAIAGYRKIIYQEDKTYNYNGAYWSLSGAIFLDRILDDYHSLKKRRFEERNNRIIELHF